MNGVSFKSISLEALGGFSRNNWNPVKTDRPVYFNTSLQRINSEDDSKNQKIKVYLRFDQFIHHIGNNKYVDDQVIMFAPKWTKMALDMLQDFISPGTIIRITDSLNKEKIKRVGQVLTLIDLATISRNESTNVTGKINFPLYGDLKQSIVLAIKDLVRQCIIIGKDRTTHYGGYGINPLVKQDKEIVLIDLIGLQFQKKINSGRLVLVGENLPVGFLDEFIFEKVVGEKRKTLGEVKLDESNRYIKCNKVYFDTYAYKKFVENDFVLVCLALNQINISNVNLKFLKYGCGFFAGPYSQILDQNISHGIYMGLKRLFASGRNKIKAFEFTFYTYCPKIDKLCKENGIECLWSREDSLRATHPELMTASTNCADPHSVTGNEMKYSSVDATIGENLLSKGFKFSPVINTAMKSQFIDTSL